MGSIFSNDKRAYINAENGINSDKAFNGISNISGILQNKILQETKDATPFFFNDSRKKIHIKNWYKRYTKTKNLINKFGLRNNFEWVNGKRIDPLFYYLYHDDILKLGVNAVKHFEKHGLNEKRQGYKLVNSL